MYQRWYYTNEGQTHGPLSPMEVRQRLVGGQLPPQVLLWPEVADLQVIVEAFTAIELVTAAAAPAGVPTPPIASAPWAPVPAAPIPAPAPAAPTPAPDWLAHLP